MHVASFVVNAIGSNCYVMSTDLTEGAEAVIVDPGDTNLTSVFDHVAQHQLTVVGVWNTHAHFDHVMGVDVVRRKYGVPAFVHKDDMPLWERLADTTRLWMGRDVPSLAPPDAFWENGQRIALGEHTFSIMHTPGHSPGSVCIVGDDVAFTGDTLFAGTIGRTDLPLSDPDAMEASLRSLLSLPDSLTLYPGHMYVTNMGKERASNPFLRL